MKKALAILLALSVLALSACAAKQANSDTQKDSNTAETEQQPDSAQTAETQQPAQEAKRIEPMAESLDLNALTDATVAASFGAEDISEKDGKMELTLTVYDYDVYDMVDISQLAVGDTIVVDGKEIPCDGKLYYRPNDSMTRQEFVVALMRFLDVDVTLYTKSDLPYADNDKIAKWAQDAMKAAYQLGYMSGSSSNGKLYAKPTATISRQEAMVILARSQKLQQEDESVLNKFTDAGRIASWARPELAAMVERGIISGSKGKLNPTGKVTRAEVAKMLYMLSTLA